MQSAVLRSHVVCLSVCLLVKCDHIGWNSSKIISSLVSLWCSLFATPTWRVCSKGNTPKFWPKVTHTPVDMSVGDIRSQIPAEWLQVAQRSQWRAYRKLPSLFLMVPSLTLYYLPFPQMGVRKNAKNHWPVGLVFTERPWSILYLKWAMILANFLLTSKLWKICILCTKYRKSFNPNFSFLCWTNVVKAC